MLASPLTNRVRTVTVGSGWPAQASTALVSKFISTCSSDAALAETSPEAVLSDYGGQGFGVFKPALAELAVAKMSPISSEMARLMNDKGEIDKILAQGAEKARAIASPVMQRTYEIVGMIGD